MHIIEADFCSQAMDLPGMQHTPLRWADILTPPLITHEVRTIMPIPSIKRNCPFLASRVWGVAPPSCRLWLRQRWRFVCDEPGG